MKHNKLWAALLAAGLLAGCGGPSSQPDKPASSEISVSEDVSTRISGDELTDTISENIASAIDDSYFGKCTGESNGLDAKVYLYADGEDAPLDKLVMVMTSSYENLVGDDEDLSQVDMKQLMGSMEGMLVRSLAEQFEIPESDIQIINAEDEMEIHITFNDIDHFLEVTTGAADLPEKITYKQAVNGLSASFTCE